MLTGNNHLGGPQRPTPVIELLGATLCRGGSTEEAGVEQVQWQVHAGDYWVVVGHADAGKSALLATAAGLLRPLVGCHRLFGNDSSTLTGHALTEARRCIGFVPEGGARLLQHLTLAENIALPLRYHQNLSPEQAAPRVNPLLEGLELEPLANSTPGQVNRGVRQRANLARALVLRPLVLMLDNPLVGLSPAQVRWWLDLLDQLARGHDGLGLPPMTLVVTSEDLRPWLSRGRQFALLKDGRWVLLGDRETLAPAHNSNLSEFLEQDRF